MSGIAGIIRFDNSIISATDIQALTRRLAHRGKVTNTVVEPSQGHGLFLSFGKATAVSTETKSIGVADINSFSVTPLTKLPVACLSDGGLFFNQLNADFALSIWNAAAGTLTCARDPLGVKPLYYTYQPGRYVAFASEIKGLLALSDVSTVPNERKFREYLTWATDYVPYSSDTFYETVYSVLPGHSITFSAQQSQTQAYWKPDLSSYRDVTSPAAYASLFKTQFEQAVDSRMREGTLIGSHLSGGLDSSSVSCVAHTLLHQQRRPILRTFNIDTGFPAADEQEYVRAVVRQYGVLHQPVQPLPDTLDAVLTIQRQFDRPEHFIIPSSFHLSVSEQARRIGCDVLLTGHDGDSSIPTGFDWLDTLFDERDWATLVQACDQFSGFSGRSMAFVRADWNDLSHQARLRSYLRYFLDAKLKLHDIVESPVQQLRLLNQQRRAFGLSLTDLVPVIARRVTARLNQQRLIEQAFTPAFLQRIHAAEVTSTQPLTRSLKTELGVPVRQLLNTINVTCNEQLNHIGAYYGHDYQFPFFDQRVMALGLATPPDVHFDQGRGRGLIRQGLRDVLPAEVTTRYTKANFLEYSHQSAQQLYQATKSSLASTDHPIWAIVNQQAFTTIVQTSFDSKVALSRKVRYNWLLSRIIYLALWLRQ